MKAYSIEDMLELTNNYSCLERFNLDVLGELFFLLLELDLESGNMPLIVTWQKIA